MSLSLSLDSKIEVWSSLKLSLVGGFSFLWHVGWSLQVKLFMAVLSWQFDSHVKESRNYNVTSGILKGSPPDCFIIVHPQTAELKVTRYFFFLASNLTAGTLYEVAVWAHTSTGDSPTTLSQQRTTGTPPKKPLLKAKALNQTAVECSWTVSGPLAKVRQAHGPKTTTTCKVEVLFCLFVPFIKSTTIYSHTQHNKSPCLTKTGKKQWEKWNS